MTAKPKVAFYVREFLSPTMTFVHNRIRSVSRSYQTLVFCRERKNADTFPHDAVTVLPAPGPFAERLQRSFSRRVLHRHPALPAPSARALAKHLIAEKPGLLHAAFGVDGIEVLPAARRAGTPLIVAFAGYDASELLADPAYLRSLRDLAKGMARAITVCEHLKRRLIEVGVPANKIVVIHNGVDLGPFRYRPAGPPGAGGTTFLHLSGFTPKKGVEVLVRAFAAAVEDGLAGRLVLAGDGPRRAAAEALVRDLELGNLVEFPGYVSPDDRGEFLAAGDVFVHPSLTDERGSQEGIPNAIKEAMAVGLPIVATRHAGIPELVTDGTHGFLAAEHDPDDLRRALLDAANCPDRWPAMGAAGRKTVEDEYNHEHEIADLCRVYEEVLAGD